MTEMQEPRRSWGWLLVEFGMDQSEAGDAGLNTDWEDAIVMEEVLNVTSWKGGAVLKIQRGGKSTRGPMNALHRKSQEVKSNWSIKARPDR